jgi:hypothetical protein
MMMARAPVGQQHDIVMRMAAIKRGPAGWCLHDGLVLLWLKPAYVSAFCCLLREELPKRGGGGCAMISCNGCQQKSQVCCCCAA